jgi:Domain of unknown function (DUF4157)
VGRLKLQRKTNSENEQQNTFNSSLIEQTANSGSGQALDPELRATLEPQFGHSFADVRVFSDAQADRMARDVDARAFTVGQNVFFRDALYDPESAQGMHLLAHELTHTIQQQGARLGENLEVDASDSNWETEAQAAGHTVLGMPSASPISISHTANAQVSRWPWDDETPEKKPGMLDSIGDLASSAAQAVGGGAVAAYDGYQKATNFKALQKGDPKLADESKGQLGEGFIRGGINGEIDAVEKLSAANNQKMVDDSKGHWYEGLAQGAAWMNNTSAQVTGGVLKGVGDIGFGLANGIAHPIDAAGGLLGITEHDLPMVGSMLKAGHGLADLGLDAAGVHYEGQGQYGKNFGELGNHLFNPLQQIEDDQKFNTNLVQGIVDPDHKGLQGLKDKPVETVTRALTNIAPIVLGGAEAAGAGEAAGGVRPPGIVEPAPPTLRSPFLPEGVPAPKPFNPVIPEVTPGIVDPLAPTLRSPALPPDIIPGPATLPSPGVTPPPTIRQPVPTQPGLGPIELAPDTIPNPNTLPGVGPKTIPGVAPEAPRLPELAPDTVRVPEFAPDTIPDPKTIPGVGPERLGTKPSPISELDPAFDSIRNEPSSDGGRGNLGPKTADGDALKAKPDSNAPVSDLDSPISPRKPPPTPTVEELLDGLLKDTREPQVHNPILGTEPTIEELLRGLRGSK